MSSALPSESQPSVLDLLAPPVEQPDLYWRSLRIFSYARIVVALLLAVSGFFFRGKLAFGAMNFALFGYASVGYILFSIACLPPIASRRYFYLQLGLQVGADILFIMVMMFASGGISSGLGLLLLSGLAATGLVSRGRLSFFYAAIASLAVLVEHTLQVLYHDGQTAQYVQAGFYCIAYFATAGVAHTLAKYLVQTQRLAAQREIDLANMAEVNQLVIRDMEDGVLVVDEEGVIRQHNARAEQMLGALHRSRRQPNLRDYAPELARRFREWRGNPAPGFDPLATVALDSKVGARFVPVGRSRNVGAVIFLEDLTNVQAQARQMKLASLGRLTANIAHEIRNPLSAISHAAELLQEEPAADPTAARLLTIMRDNVDRLNRIVNDVLRLNREARAHRERFRLAEFLHTFIEQFAQIEKIDPQIFALELTTDPRVEFDRSHLNQVMWNLCRNALRYCRRQRASIRIAARTLDDRGIVKLDVMDDGPGVPPQSRNQLFEPFFTTDNNGTGLGLYIAREVCEANAARLEYVETPQGAQFTVWCKGTGSV